MNFLIDTLLDVMSVITVKMLDKYYVWRSKYNRRLFDFTDKSYLRREVM